jgi:PQQ-dependent catabolism-associated beta-propeller protein
VERTMRARFLAPVVFTTAALIIGASAPAPGQRSGLRAFVSNEFGGDVAVIDAAADRLVGRLKVGPAGTARPRGMALSPDGGTLYLAVTDATYGQSDGGRQWQFIAGIDVAAGRITAKYPCGSDPERLAVSPDGGLLYCSNEDGAGASVLDVRTAKVIATIPTGIEPEGVAVSPDGRWLYVTAETSNTVTIIDARRKTPVKNILVGARPRFSIFAPDGLRVYVTSETAGTMTVIDAHTQTVARTVALGTDSKPVGIAVSPDGRWAYVSGGRCNCVDAIDTRTFKVTTIVQRMGRRPWGVAVTSDGKKIYTANGRSDDVTVIDAASLAVIRTIDRVGRGPHSVVFGR